MLQHSFGSRGRVALRKAGVVGLLMLCLGLNVAWSIWPHRKPHPADMTQRATAVGPLLHASPSHSPAPTPTPPPKPTPAAVAQTSPHPVSTPEPHRKHKPAEMTQRATAVGPLLAVSPKRSSSARTITRSASAPEPEPTPTPEPAAPEAQEIHRIGLVKVIGAGGTFLLIEARDTFSSADLPTGTELRCRGSAATGGEQTALLRISPERRDPFIVADIVSGSPQVGDGVYLPDADTKPR